MTDDVDVDPFEGRHWLRDVPTIGLLLVTVTTAYAVLVVLDPTASLPVRVIAALLVVAAPVALRLDASVERRNRLRDD